jgi:exosortase H (IPTLxxWG-CTERM-specific)
VSNQAPEAADLSIGRFLLAFTLVASIGFAIELMPWVDIYFVVPLIKAIAWTAGHAIQWAGGSAEVIDHVIQQPKGGFAIAVANGCSGLEAVILLNAAIIAFPATWSWRIRGVLIGTVVIMAFNLLRVISLFYIGQYSKQWFDWAHLYIWDIIIMLDGLLVFILWVRQLPPMPRGDVAV